MLKFIRRIYAKKTFHDGSYIEPTTKESMIFVDKNLKIDFDFYCNKNHCSIYLESSLDDSIFDNFKSKIQEYCLDRGYTFEIYKK